MSARNQTKGVLTQAPVMAGGDMRRVTIGALKTHKEMMVKPGAQNNSIE